MEAIDKKYYVPYSNEFKVGAIMQRYKPFSLKWENIEITDDDFRNDLNERNNNEFTNFIQHPDLYRIKVLDKEDIESIGFMFIKDCKSKGYPYPIEVYKDKGSNMVISKYSKSLFLKIHTTDNKNLKKLKYIDNIGHTFFLGNIRNKQELNDIISKFS